MLPTVPVRPFHLYTDPNTFPPYEKPFEFCYFSYDHKRRIKFDRSSLKFYCPPVGPVDLSTGFEKRIERPEVEEHLDGLLEAILNIRLNSNKPETKGSVPAISAEQNSPLFVTWRGIMTKIFASPYNSNDPWTFRATRLNVIL
jgi:RAT1-interacting protein